MDQLRALIDAGQYAQVLERVRRTPAQPQALLLGAQAALNLGQSDLAREWLESLPPFEEASLEADRLSILGYAYHNLGYPDRYQQLAQQAVAIEQNAFTLLHLGRSLPPDRAMVILRESLVQARTPREEGNVAYVLARLCEQLGRFREGLAYASLAMLRDPDDPIRFLAYAGLILTSSDETFSPGLLKQLIAFTRHEEAMYRMVALHILADYQLAQAQLTQALRTSEQLQAQVGKDLWPLFAWQAVRICQRMGQRERALQVARAVESSELGDSNVQGMGYLALGQAHYPQPESVTYFERAQSHFQQINPAGALVARAFLAQLAGQPLSQNDRDLVAQWSTALCDALPSGAIHEVRGYTLTTFGQVELRGAEGKIPLRPRSLELLVLLQTNTEGWRWEDLSMALYGQLRANALKVEMLRLRRQMGGVESRPWRVVLPIWVDFVTLRKYLAQGNLAGAIGLWQGAFMPGSTAPAIREMGRELEEELCSVVLASGQPEQLLLLAERLPDNLALARALLDLLPRDDQRQYALLARIRRLAAHSG